MAAVYLVAYLLKDLTPELFTQDATGESLTRNINLSLWAATELRCHFRAGHLVPFMHFTLVPVQISTI